jgi:hypothetical protein
MALPVSTLHRDQSNIGSPRGKESTKEEKEEQKRGARRGKLLGTNPKLKRPQWTILHVALKGQHPWQWTLFWLTPCGNPTVSDSGTWTYSSALRRGPVRRDRGRTQRDSRPQPSSTLAAGSLQLPPTPTEYSNSLAFLCHGTC